MAPERERVHWLHVSGALSAAQHGRVGIVRALAFSAALWRKDVDDHRQRHFQSKWATWGAFARSRSWVLRSRRAKRLWKAAQKIQAS